VKKFGVIGGSLKGDTDKKGEEVDMLRNKRNRKRVSAFCVLIWLCLNLVVYCYTMTYLPGGFFLKLLTFAFFFLCLFFLAYYIKEVKTQ